MTVAFIGHRTLDNREAIKERLLREIENLIINEKANTFIFGSRSKFNDLCYDIVSAYKIKFPYLCRIFVRAEYECIDKEYLDYLLTLYEDTFFPKQAHGAKALSYIKRNQVMIDMCDVLIVYYDENYKPKKTNSGTKLAFDYARKQRKKFINVF